MKKQNDKKVIDCKNKIEDRFKDLFVHDINKSQGENMNLYNERYIKDLNKYI